MSNCSCPVTFTEHDTVIIFGRDIPALSSPRGGNLSPNFDNKTLGTPGVDAPPPTHPSFENPVSSIYHKRLGAGAFRQLHLLGLPFPPEPEERPPGRSLGTFSGNVSLPPR